MPRPKKKAHHSQGTGSSNHKLEVVVAAAPRSELEVSVEVELVKAALLYADRVTLLSPTAYMVLRIREVRSAPTTRLLEMLRQTALYLNPGATETHELVSRLLESGLGNSGIDGLLRRWGAWNELQEIRSELVTACEEIASKSGVDSLARARDAGLLKVARLDDGSVWDLMASCVVSAKLRQQGEDDKNASTDRVVDGFCDGLFEQLGAGSRYLMFDEFVASLAREAIREGVVKPSGSAVRLATEAMLASGLMGQLPTFPFVGVDEILDIRSELEQPLRGFRRSMIAASRVTSVEPWNQEFQDEIRDLWAGEVGPAIEEIDEAVRMNRSLLKLAKECGPAVGGGLAVLATGLACGSQPGPLVAESVASMLPALAIAWNRRAANQKVTMMPFYFLYRIENTLRRTVR